MNNKLRILIKIFSGFGVFFLAVAIVGIIGLYKQRVAQGSVTQGNDYFSTTTDKYQNVASSTKVIILKTGSGSLGSVIIGSTTALTSTSSLRIYDSRNYVAGNATSGVATSSASSTLAIFSPTAAEGTYTFDTTFNQGLLLEFPSDFAGGYTITYR